jgi:hypothetical protein
VRGLPLLSLKKITAFILILLILTVTCYAEEEKDTKNTDNTLTQKIEKLMPDDEEGSIQEKVGKILPKAGESFNFEKIDPEKVIDKTQATGDQLYLIAQAYSWPMFVWSIVLGVGGLFLGGITGFSWLKKTGGFFLLMAFLRVIIINYAPELVSIIINWIEGVKGG